jgi:uncharacterized protein YoaH (UPF0181 family)
MAGLDPMELFALWMFTHEEADELMKSAVERGQGVTGEGMSGGADAFTDGFMAMVASEKERLKARLAAGEAVVEEDASDERFAELRFEIGELRGRLDQMQATLDAIAAHLDAKGA